MTALAADRAARAAALARPLTALEAAAVRDRWDTARARTGRPSGILRLDGALTEDELAEFRDRWQQAHGRSSPAMLRWVPDACWYLYGPWSPGETAIVTGTRRATCDRPWWRRVWERIRP